MKNIFFTVLLFIAPSFAYAQDSRENAVVKIMKAEASEADKNIGPLHISADGVKECARSHRVLHSLPEYKEVGTKKIQVFSPGRNGGCEWKEVKVLGPWYTQADAKSADISRKMLNDWVNLTANKNADYTLKDFAENWKKANGYSAKDAAKFAEKVCAVK